MNINEEVEALQKCVDAITDVRKLEEPSDEDMDKTTQRMLSWLVSYYGFVLKINP